MFHIGDESVVSVSNGVATKETPEAGAQQPSRDKAEATSTTCSISDVDNLPIMNAADAATMLTPSSSMPKFSKEAMDVLQTTPELASNPNEVIRREKSGGSANRPISLDLENLPEGVTASSIFAEITSHEPEMIGEMDTGADIIAMGKELENVMSENKELVANK